MLKGFIILILWLILGFSTDYLIAKWNYIENTSMRIEVTFLTLGVYASLFHCAFIKLRHKTLSYSLFVLPSFLVFLVSWQLIAFYHTKFTCTISEPESLKAAMTFLETIEYDPQFMSKKSYKLDWCKLGFEYESPEHFRLIIVSADGTVKLNE